MGLLLHPADSMETDTALSWISFVGIETPPSKADNPCAAVEATACDNPVSGCWDLVVTKTSITMPIVAVDNYPVERLDRTPIVIRLAVVVGIFGRSRHLHYKNCVATEAPRPSNACRGRFSPNDCSAFSTCYAPGLDVIAT